MTRSWDVNGMGSILELGKLQCIGELTSQKLREFLVLVPRMFRHKVSCFRRNNMSEQYRNIETHRIQKFKCRNTKRRVCNQYIFGSRCLLHLVVMTTHFHQACAIFLPILFHPSFFYPLYIVNYNQPLTFSI